MIHQLALCCWLVSQVDVKFKQILNALRFETAFDKNLVPEKFTAYCFQIYIFEGLKMLLVRKWMSNFTKLHLSLEIFKNLPVFSQFLWNLTLIFSDSHEKFSLVLLQMTNYIFSPWMQYLQGFCPLRIKITQFPCGFRLNFFLKLVLPCYENKSNTRTPYVNLIFIPQKIPRSE